MNKPPGFTKQMSERPLIALRLPKVLEYTGLSKTQAYRLISAGDFPAPKKLSEGVSAWSLEEIESWLQKKFLSPVKPAKGSEAQNAK